MSHSIKSFEQFLKTQMETARVLHEQYLEINRIAEKYGGSACVIHDTVQVRVPKERLDELLKEIGRMTYKEVQDNGDNHFGQES